MGECIFTWAFATYHVVLVLMLVVLLLVHMCRALVKHKVVRTD